MKNDNQQSCENNIAWRLNQQVEANPTGGAITFYQGKDYKTWSFADLMSNVDAYAHVLAKSGVKRGQKALLMLTAGPELIAVAYSLFKMGVLPVILDPGMGKEQMFRCIKHVEPEVFIGVTKAHIARTIFRDPFKSVKHFFTALDWFPFTVSLAREAAKAKSKEPYPIAEVKPTDTAAILFTSGSTGPAKGVVYQHGMFQAQLNYLEKLFHFKPGESDLSCYPSFALFDVALGMTSIIPRLDPSKPAACDPALLIDAAERFNAVSCQGSPIIWRRLCNYCKEVDHKLPSLKRVITFGAPIPPDLLQQLKQLIHSEGDIYTPYGATECLPVALIAGSQILAETAEKTSEGMGTCVGKTVKGLNVKIIKITDEPIENMTSDIELPVGEIGEITVLGEQTTQEYYLEPEANKMAKIKDESGRFWHRMGDVGYFDSDNMLWFCGRKKHRIETAKGTLFPVQAEGMANTHPAVFRSALVGVGEPGNQEPVLVVEPKEGAFPSDEKAEALLSRQILARYDDNPKFSQITRAFFYDNFPVDPRHNVKIHREELALWVKDR